MAAPKPKPKSKSKSAATAPVPPSPKLALVTAETITAAQLRKLIQEGKAADDHGLVAEAKIALDGNASATKRKYALDICVEPWNALERIKARL